MSDEAIYAAAVAEHAEHGVDVIKVMALGGFATPGSDQLAPNSLVTDSDLSEEISLLCQPREVLVRGTPVNLTEGSPPGFERR